MKKQFPKPKKYAKKKKEERKKETGTLRQDFLGSIFWGGSYSIISCLSSQCTSQRCYVSNRGQILEKHFNKQHIRNLN